MHRNNYVYGCDDLLDHLVGKREQKALATPPPGAKPATRLTGRVG
ncbi:MAG TPA: hypothetical protein VKB89_27060 [Xanthobacteraceae bacterium]|nr:hypothetical protein [Xanthobacteraceae bacterium]